MTNKLPQNSLKSTVFCSSQEFKSEIWFTKTVTLKYFNLLVSGVIGGEKRPENFVSQVLSVAEKSSLLGFSNGDRHFGAMKIYFELFLVPRDIFWVNGCFSVFCSKKRFEQLSIPNYIKFITFTNKSYIILLEINEVLHNS